MTNQDLAVRMAQLARAVAVPRSMDEILSDVTAAGVELIDGVDTAGVLLLTRGGGYESHATTNEVPHELDDLQHTLDEGPCLDAARDDEVVRVDDFRTETRWPAYSAAVIKIGILSTLSFRLYSAGRTAGALNLFGYQPREWDSDAVTTGSVLAAHAAAAVLASRQSEQLHSALASRDAIGQAKGIIMERFRVDDVRAFDLLRQLSQEGNVRLTDIAARIIDTSGEHAGDVL